MRLIIAGEVDPIKLRVYFNVRLASDMTLPALAEVGGQPQLSVNGGLYDNAGIAPLVSIGYGHYYAAIDSSFVLVAGDVLQTRYKSILTIETPGSDIQVVTNIGLLPDNPIASTYYGSITEADFFFQTELKNVAWTSASITDKTKALRIATRTIDRLNFSGTKADVNQNLQFPRKNSIINSDNIIVTFEDTFVPEDIKIATYHVSYALLDGYDPDIEISNLPAIEQRLTVSTKYDRSFVLDHIRAGIPSAVAWGFLRPYLKDINEVTLSRV